MQSLKWQVWEPTAEAYASVTKKHSCWVSAAITKSNLVHTCAKDLWHVFSYIYIHEHHLHIIYVRLCTECTCQSPEPGAGALGPGELPVARPPGAGGTAPGPSCKSARPPVRAFGSGLGCSVNERISADGPFVSYPFVDCARHAWLVSAGERLRRCEKAKGEGRMAWPFQKDTALWHRAPHQGISSCRALCQLWSAVLRVSVGPSPGSSLLTAGFGPAKAASRGGNSMLAGLWTPSECMVCTCRRVSEFTTG